MLGVASGDISTLSIQTGNIRALKDNRVEVYPWSHIPTKVLFRRVSENVSIDVTRGPLSSTIRWHGLKRADLTGFVHELAGRLETKRVYVSIDKDCLSSPWALTNWEQGLMGLEELLRMVGLIRENFEVVGVDVTGEYSSPVVTGGFKGIVSRLDHPKEYSALGKAQSQITFVNQRTNTALAESFS